MFSSANPQTQAQVRQNGSVFQVRSIFRFPVLCNNVDPFMCFLYSSVLDSAYLAATVVNVEDVLPFVPMEVLLPGKELGE